MKNKNNYGESTREYYVKDEIANVSINDAQKQTTYSISEKKFF